MTNSFSLAQLAKEIGGTFKGDASLILKGVAPIEKAGSSDLTFLTNSRYVSAAAHTQASVILTDKELPDIEKSFLLSSNPYAALAKVMRRYRSRRELLFRQARILVRAWFYILEFLSVKIAVSARIASSILMYQFEKIVFWGNGLFFSLV